jgi:pimeloyl-ACP methyl ester carboxylesterase
MTRDVIIVIPGIMGSALVDARGRPVWSLRPGALVQAIRTLGGSLRALTLREEIGDEPPGDGVRAVGLLPGLHVIPGLWSPVAGYAGILRFLRGPRFQLIEPDPRHPERIPNLITFPYDWRLSNRYNGRLLAKTAVDALDRWRSQPGMAEAKLILVCHSMGGLVARWFLDREGGAALTRRLITIGTPHRGAVNSLGTLANGVEPGVGRLRLRLTGFARSMPSLYQLLPTYACMQLVGDERTTLAGVNVPGLDPAMVADAARFHADLDAAGPAPYVLHKVVGIRQPTMTTARVYGGEVQLRSDIDRREQGGDGTVPRLSAEPAAGRGTEVHEVAEQHGELQNARSTLDLLDGIVTREEVVWEGVPAEAFGVSMPELWAPGSAPERSVTDLADRRLRVVVSDERGQPVGAPVVVRPDGRAVLDPLPPGGYRARVESPVPGGPPAVTHPFLVWDPDTTVEDLDLAGDGG